MSNSVEPIQRLIRDVDGDLHVVRAASEQGYIETALEACLSGIRASLERGDRVTLSGFGTFGVSQHKARRVRNPRSGRAIEVQAKRVPRFAPGAESRRPG